MITVVLASWLYFNLIAFILSRVFFLLDRIVQKTPGCEERDVKTVKRMANAWQLFTALAWTGACSFYCGWLADRLVASVTWPLFIVIPIAVRHLEIGWPESPFDEEARQRKGARALFAFTAFLSMSLGWAILSYLLSKDDAVSKPVIAGVCSFLAAVTAWRVGGIFFSLGYRPDHRLVNIQCWDNYAAAFVMLASFTICGVVGGTGGWWIAAFLAACYGIRRGWLYVYWRRVDFFTKTFFKHFNATNLDERQKLEKAYKLAVETVNEGLRGKNDGDAV